MVPLRICLLIALWLCSIPAKADLIIDVLDSNISVDGTPGFIDVEIRSSTGTSHNVSLVGYEFAITNLSSPTLGSLQFLDSQILDEQDDPNYLFHAFRPNDNSFSAAANSLSYIGADVTTGGAATVSDSSIQPPLLVRLDVQYLLPSTTDRETVLASKPQFRVSLVAPSANTVFWDENGNTIDFTSNPGIASITAVPEPSSLQLILAVGSGLIFLRRKKLRRVPFFTR